MATGLVVIQLLMAIRGERGVLEVSTALGRYGAAFAVTVGGVGALLYLADTLTHILLVRGLHTLSFQGVLQQMPVGPTAITGVGPVELGLIGLFGLLPVAFGYAVEMIFRYAAILVLIATVPITTTALITRPTARWFWITLRWLLVAIVMKPALALLLFAGRGPLAQTHGLVGLLAAVSVMWVALLCPWALYVLVRCADPATSIGEGFHDQIAHLVARALRRARWRYPATAGLDLAAVTVVDRHGVNRSHRRFPTSSGHSCLDRVRSVRRYLRSRSGCGWAIGTRRVSPAGPNHDVAVRYTASGLGTGQLALCGPVSQLRFHDGPVFRGHRRVCVLHDVAQDRWGATARWVTSEVNTADRHWAVRLADGLTSLLWSLDGNTLVDRLSIMLRAQHGGSPHDGPVAPNRHDDHDAAGYPLQRGGDGGGVPGLQYEVFVTVSGPEPALRCNGQDAGGGPSGRAWAAYRVLDDLDHAVTSRGLGSVSWLSSGDLAITLDTLGNGRATIVAVAPGRKASIDDTIATPAARPVNQECEPPASCVSTQGSRSPWHETGSTTRSYAVDTPTAGVDVGALAALLAATQRGERRCVAVHHDLPDRGPHATFDAARPHARSGGTWTDLPWGDGQLKAVIDRPRDARALAALSGDAVGSLDIGCAVWVAVSSAGLEQIDDHAARLEHDASDLLGLIPTPRQDLGYVAACLPLGVTPSYDDGGLR